MTAITYEMMLARIAALTSEGATREALAAGPSPYAAIERIQDAIRAGACFVCRQFNGPRMYFKTQADAEAFSKSVSICAQAGNVMLERLTKGGSRGIDRATLTEGMSQRQREQAIRALYVAGKMFVYGSGPFRRYFCRQDWFTAYKAEREQAAREKWLSLQRKYKKAKYTAVPKPAKAPKVVKATKPKQSKKPKPVQIIRSAQPWTPPKPKAPQPIIIPKGLKIQKLPGAPYDRWGVTSAPKIITAVDCREWAKAATC